MNWRFCGAAVIVLLVFLTLNAQSTTAQKSITLAATPSMSAAPTPADPARPGHALIEVRVLEDSGAPFAKQAVAQLWSQDTPPIYAVTQEGAHANFDGLQSQRYLIRVSAAGYETAEKGLETFPNDTYYQAIFKLKRKPNPPADDPASLEPKTEGPAASTSAAPAPDLKMESSSRSWGPGAVDQEQVTIADGIVCPTATVLDGAMQRADELVQNANRFAATEQVLHEDLNAEGKVVLTEHRKFDYVVSITELPSGDLDVDETRDGTAGYEDFPAHIATLGLPSLAFLFHERYRDDYRFDCRGLGEWRGHAAWLVDFRQRPDRKSRIRGYSVGGTLYPISLKGRAWIAADSFEVMRMEADAVKPVPEIKLRDEHQTIEYAPVHFRTGDTELWLPASADLYFDFRHHKYHRVHTFDSYLLFSVSVSQKIGTPKQVAQK